MAQASLHNKVVVVTGGASGIGLHTVKDFLSEGARVVVVDIDDQALQEQVHELCRVSGRDRVLALCCDLTDDDALNNLVPQIVGHWGTIDVLVNNAGCAIGGHFVDGNARRMRTMVDLNLYVPMRLTQLVLPQMQKQGQGHIVNIYSSSATLAVPGYAAYEGTKGGLFVFTRALRRELRGTNITLTAFCPGSTETPMTAKQVQGENKGALADFHTPEIPAAAVVAAVKNRKAHVVVSDHPLAQAVMTFIDRVFPGALDNWWHKQADEPYYQAAARVGRG